MKIKFMIGFLPYLSVGLVHECHAGGVNSTPAVEVRDERRDVTVRQRTTPSQQPITTTSFQPAPQQVAQPAPQDHEYHAGAGNSIPAAEVRDERRGVPVKQSTTPAPLPTTTTSFQSAPKPAVYPPQQGLGDAPTSSPSSVIQPRSSTDERALVPYKMLTFRGHEIPYPQSAQVELDEKSTLLLKQAICSIILLTEDQRKTHELAQKMESNSAVPKNPDALNGYFEKIYADLTRIGAATAKVESAEEAIQTLKKLVQHVKLSEIYADTKFQRNPASLISRVMITMNSGGEVIILNVHGLPEELWAKSK